MSLFEDPKLEYYRKWDRQYDEEKAKAKKAKAEDARMLAYERKRLTRKVPGMTTQRFDRLYT